MVKFKVIELSHPAAFGITAKYVPEVVYVVPFAGQKYESHAVMLVVELEPALTVKFSVTVESHPRELVTVVVYEPLVV